MKIVLKEKVNYNDIENYIKKLFVKLDKQGFDTNGLYTINIYHDKIYKDIIEIIKEKYNNFIDIKLNIIDTVFLYKIDKYNINQKNLEKYLYNNEIYVKIKTALNKKDYYNLLEHSKVIYDTEKIFKCAKKML